MAKQLIARLFSKHLLATNTVCSVTLLAAGDLIQQGVVAYRKEDKTYKIDFTRTARMATCGLLLGPMNHFWYLYLDRILPGRSGFTLLKKIFLDQLACPAFSSVFVCSMALLEGHALPDAVGEYARKFFTIYLLDWCVWPPTQLINFWLLPPSMRVVYVYTVSLFYSTVMSYIKHESVMAKQLIARLFSKHLLATNTVCSVTLLAAGDLIQQGVVAYRKEDKTYKIDFTRTARMATCGLLLGPMNHFWYLYLDRILPGRSGFTLLKKIFLDQLACPAFSSVFVCSMALLEGHALPDAVGEYARKFFTIYLLDWCVWPPTQLINFWLLPPSMRVVYVYTVSLFYSTVMSYIKHENSNVVPYDWQQASKYAHHFDDHAPYPIDIGPFPMNSFEC